MGWRRAGQPFNPGGSGGGGAVAGTQNQIARFTAANAVGDSAIRDYVDGNGERVIGSANGVRWDILGPFGPDVDTGLQVVMSGNNHAAEAVAIVGYVTSMDFDLAKGSQHAIGGQFKADATISTPSGVEVLENIAVQGEASGGTRNYSWYSNTGTMRQRGDVQLAVDDLTPRYVLLGPAGGSLPAGGECRVNLDLSVDPLRTVDLGQNVLPFAMPGTASTNPSIRVGRTSTASAFQVAVQNTVNNGSETGVAVHIDTTPISSARGGLRFFRGPNGNTHVGGCEVAGGTNSLVNGSLANDVLLYSRASGARLILGTGDGTTPSAALLIDKDRQVTVVEPALGVELGVGGPKVLAGTGDPEGAVTAPNGSIWLRLDGGAGTSFYVKEPGGTSNTGWVPK